MLELSICDSYTNTSSYLPVSSKNNERKLSKNNTTGYRGVSLHRTNRWAAYLWSNGKSRKIGQFKTPIEAAKAFDRAKLAGRPNCKTLNFPELREQYLAEIEAERARQLALSF